MREVISIIDNLIFECISRCEAKVLTEKGLKILHNVCSVTRKSRGDGDEKEVGHGSAKSTNN